MCMIYTMERFISPGDSFVVERAIHYLVSEYAKSGRNPKPVVLHSIRLSLHLLELGYDTNVIVTGLLHDLIEDSDVTLQDIREKFGTDIAKWVEAVSFNPDIEDPVRQYQEMFARTVAAGKVPVVVKAADLHANSLYIKLVPEVEKQRILMEKIRYFLDIATAFQNEPIIQRLKQRYEEERNRLEKAETERGGQ